MLSYWYRVGKGGGGAAACEPGEMKMKHYFMSQPVSVSPTAKPHEDGRHQSGRPTPACEWLVQPTERGINQERQSSCRGVL